MIVVVVMVCEMGVFGIVGLYLEGLYLLVVCKGVYFVELICLMMDEDLIFYLEVVFKLLVFKIILVLESVLID